MVYFLLFLLVFNLYFYFDLILPPKVKIIQPQNKEVVKSDSVVFKGYVDRISDLFINEIPVYFDENGYFEKEFFLKQGVNRFIIKVVKFLGQEKKFEYEIVFFPK